MILAMCGAVIDSFQIGEDGLVIRSDDGRAIEVPYALNEDGIIIEALPGGDSVMPRRMLLLLALP